MYLFDPQGEVVDEVSSGYSIQNEYVYFDGRRIARRDGSGNVTYLFSDQICSSRVITDSSGNVCYDADFYPFGGERAYTTSCAQNYKFTGQERDAESNLDNFIARFYSSAEGHFMSPDPLSGDIGDPQSLNRYAYVRNNPLTLTDPTGMSPCDGDGPNGAGCSGDCDGPCGYDDTPIWDVGLSTIPPEVNDPPNPGDNPNPPSGDPDPNGPFSGPIWQEGGPQIPTGNLAALLGLQMPSPFIIDNWTNNNGTIVGDYNGEQLCGVFSVCVYWNLAFREWDSRQRSQMQSLKPQYSKSYTDFLACEVQQDIANVDQEANTKLNAFVVVNTAPFVFARQANVPATLTSLAVAAVFDLGYVLKNRETCAQTVYGPGHF